MRVWTLGMLGMLVAVAVAADAPTVVPFPKKDLAAAKIESLTIENVDLTLEILQRRAADLVDMRRAAAARLSSIVEGLSPAGSTCQADVQAGVLRCQPTAPVQE